MALSATGMVPTVQAQQQVFTRQASPGGPELMLTVPQVHDIVHALADSVAAMYVFEPEGKALRNFLLTTLQQGTYDGFIHAETLAQKLTQDLQGQSNDKHFGMIAPSPGPVRGMPENMESYAYQNFYFRKMEILPGNVAYLELNGMLDRRFTASLIMSVMTFCSHADAIILDLRQVQGGFPETVSLLAGYFFEQPVLFHSGYIRARGITFNHWTSEVHITANETNRDIRTGKPVELPITLDYRKLQQMPVYILTSNTTFSAGEMMAYGMQAQKRGRIIGESTGGGAHGVWPVMMPHGFRAMIPYMQAINPVTKSNWEKVGVQPDVKTTAPEALREAHLLAIEALKQTASPEKKRQYDWEVDMIKNLYTPWELTAKEAKDYVGHYEGREVVFVDGVLNSIPETVKALRPLKTLIRADDKFQSVRNSQVKVQFMREGKKVVAMKVIYSDGREEVYKKLD